MGWVRKGATESILRAGLRLRRLPRAYLDANRHYHVFVTNRDAWQVKYVQNVAERR